MFTRNDPRAELLLAVHEGRVTAEARPGWTEWLLDGKEPYFGYLGHMQSEGLVNFDSEAPAPAVARLTELGGVHLAALFGIAVPVEAVAEGEHRDAADEPDEDDTMDLDPAPAQQVFPPTVPAGETTSSIGSGGGVTIEYFGLGLSCLDFVNGKQFRDAVGKHGYELLLDGSSGGESRLALDQPLTGENSYLSVVDPVSGGRFYVLYDDEASSDLESPGFVEILALMDAYCKEQSQSRLFMAEPETDEEEDELDLWVNEEHPFYGLEFDFATGKYVRV